VKPGYDKPGFDPVIGNAYKLISYEDCLGYASDIAGDKTEVDKYSYQLPGL
jgi:hypothetical protein